MYAEISKLIRKMASVITRKFDEIYGKNLVTYSSQWRTQEKISGVQGYGRPRRGSGGAAPRTPENFRKFAKKFLRKLQKMNYFSIFFKEI